MSDDEFNKFMGNGGDLFFEALDAVDEELKAKNTLISAKEEKIAMLKLI